MEHNSPSNKNKRMYMHRILSSQELKGFWEDIDRMRKQRMGKLLKERDANSIDGINVIDKIVALKESYAK